MLKLGTAERFAHAVEQSPLIVAEDADAPRRAIDNPESLCADARLDGKFEGHGSLAGEGDLRATPLRDLAFQNAGGVLHRRRCLRGQNTPAPNRPAPPKRRHRRAAAQSPDKVER